MFLGASGGDFGRDSGERGWGFLGHVHAKVPQQRTRVGLVLSGKARPFVETYMAAKTALKNHGFEPVGIDVNHLRRDKLHELVRGGCKTFVAIGPTAARLLHHRLPPGTNLVYCMVRDPIPLGLNKGKRSVTGVCSEVSPVCEIDVISQAVKGASRIGMLYNSQDEQSKRNVEAVRGMLPKGWKLEAVDLKAHKGIGQALHVLFMKRIDIYRLDFDPSVYANDATVRMALLDSLRNGIPTFSSSIEAIRAGALIGVGVKPSDQGLQVAQIVKQLKAEAGAIKEFRVEPAYVLGINMRIAKTLKMSIPKSLVERADQIIGDGPVRKPSGSQSRRQPFRNN